MFSVESHSHDLFYQFLFQFFYHSCKTKSNFFNIVENEFWFEWKICSIYPKISTECFEFFIMKIIDMVYDLITCGWKSFLKCSNSIIILIFYWFSFGWSIFLAINSRGLEIVELDDRQSPCPHQFPTCQEAKIFFRRFSHDQFSRPCKFVSLIFLRYLQLMKTT